MKTNAVRMLETAGVRFEVRAYEVDPEDLSAEVVAAKIGMPAEQVFKTRWRGKTGTASALRWFRVTPNWI